MVAVDVVMAMDIGGWWLVVVPLMLLLIMGSKRRNCHYKTNPVRYWGKGSTIGW